MLKKLAIFVPLSILAAATVWVFAAGSANDPLVSLSYLTQVFTAAVEKEVDKRLGASDTQLINSLSNVKVEQPSTAPAASAASNWTETRLKKGDILHGVTGTNVLLLAGSAQVLYDGGTVVDAERLWCY